MTRSTPSLHIYPDHYYCFGCGAHGDHLDWLMQVEGLGIPRRRTCSTTGTARSFPRATATCEEIDASGERTGTCPAIVGRRQADPGTLAARYLADTRGIDLDALPANIDDALRFHPNCPFGPGVTHPCLLALMRDAVGNAPTGIQRIALTADAQKIDRMMFGPAGVVKLWPAGKQLVIGEGLETMLAAATRLPYRGAPLRPAWAVLSDGAPERISRHRRRRAADRARR